MTSHQYSEKEKIGIYHGEYMPNQEMPRSERQELFDNVLQIQKELACEIYIQRDKERYL